MWFWWLFLLAPEIYYASEEQTDCQNIDCDHDNVKVCGVRGGGVKEVAFRLFQDECALRKFECEEAEMKGFRPVGIEYCTQAFSLNSRTISPIENYTATEEIQTEVSELDEINAVTTYGLSDGINDSKRPICIKCDCSIKSKMICAIRAEGVRFIVRWFADKCHMLQYNCEKKLNFSVTDDYICVEDKSISKAYKVAEEAGTKTTRNYEEKETVELMFETEKSVSIENKKCYQIDCITDREICAIRPEDERFIIRRFSDECDMLQYNCEKHVNFTVIEDYICDRVDNAHNTRSKESQIIESDIVTEVEDTRELLDLTGNMATSETAAVSNGHTYTFKEPIESQAYPRNVVVSTYDMNENINQTVENFFAASRLKGIRIQKFEDEETRRMIIKDTGPVNLFVPRAFVPANYTPVENKNQSKQYPEYSPLVKYCYHKCPQKCPEIYRPVCGARIDNKKQTPFIFFKNHCYMDIAKCHMWWAGFKGNNFTEIEEMGFLFCGGARTMNMIHMFPLIRILQKMGRLKKKGRVHFVMRNLGQFPVPLQG